MADREKVIRGLTACNRRPIDGDGSDCQNCPYYDDEDTAELPFGICNIQDMFDDALALLKERKPKYHMKIITNGNCTVCGKPLGGDTLFLCEECRQKEQEEHHD